MMTFEQLERTPAYAAAAKDYDEAAAAMHELSRSIGQRLWDLPIWSRGWRNPYPVGSEAYDALEAVRKRGLELVKRWREAGDRKDELERAAGFGGCGAYEDKGGA